MSPGRIVSALAVMAIVSVLAIFFFPSMQGPYSVVHGPASALLSFRAATMLRKAMARAGQSVRQIRKHIRAAVPSWSAKAISVMEITADAAPAGGSILRC